MMNFVTLEMPLHRTDGISPRAMRALEIYTEIEDSGYYKLDKPQHQEELLGDFVEREAYGAVDTEGNLQGISLYIPDMDTSYGWIEGLAVHPESRRKHVGSYLVKNMIAVARLDGKKRLELTSKKSAHAFWLNQGFKNSGSPDAPDDLRMSLDIL